MRRLPWAVATALAALLAACTTTNERVITQDAGFVPPANARILLVAPDVQLFQLNAAGTTEPRADWSVAARENLAAALDRALRTQGHSPEAIDLSPYDSGRPGQIIRLHEAVGASILAFEYGLWRLPTKDGAFDWTLGAGAHEIAALAEGADADFALFLVARGSYSTSGRVAAAIGLALIGASVPMGGQQIYASLVDLETGDVEWFHVAIPAAGTDMRTPEGAQSLTGALLESAPL